MARYYFDCNRATSTNGTTQTESAHFYLKTVANQRQARVTALSIIARGSTAGGGAARLKTNTGTATSGGTASNPAKRDQTGAAAGTTGFSDASAITETTPTYIVKQSVGFAQTGGNNMWVATEPDAAIQMEPNATNPVTVIVHSIAIGTSIPIDLTLELYE